MLSLKLAFFFIKKHIMESFLIVITVAVGVATQLFIVTISASLDDMIESMIVEKPEHIVIRSKDDTMLFTDKDMINHIKSYAEVKEVSYALMQSGYLVKENGERIPYYMTFIDRAQAYQMYGIEEKTKRSGELPATNIITDYEIMLPNAFANKHFILPGDRISYTWYDISTRSMRIVYYYISGTYELNTFELATNSGFALLGSIGDINHIPVTQLVIKLHDINDQKHMIKTLLQDTYLVNRGMNQYQWTSFEDTYPELVVLNRAQSVVTILIQVFVSFGIYLIITSIIGFSIYKKIKQIGILKAMGFQQKDVTKTILFQSIILDGIGAILGIIASLFAADIFQNMMTYPDGNKRIHIDDRIEYYVIAITIVAVVIILASLASIRKTKRVTMIELIKT